MMPRKDSYMSHAGHEIVKCPNGHVLQQCRCAELDKPVRISHARCAECEAAKPNGKLVREINTHKVNGLNESIGVHVVDDLGPGGANHEYMIVAGFGNGCEIKFQNGPINEAGINGISNEALLAVVIDRLQGFQSGAFKCRENAIALTHLEDAMHWLQHRTQARVLRGVEGTSKV